MMKLAGSRFPRRSEGPGCFVGGVVGNQIHTIEMLHSGLAELVEKKKLYIKSACYIAQLDIHAEQLRVLRFYNENGVLPTIRQAREILKVHNQKRLTLKAFWGIMAASLIPQKVVFSYSDIAPYFDETM